MADSPPNTIDGRIQFFQQRLAAWAADPAAIGLTAEQIGDLQTKLTLAANARSTALTARQQARSATSIQNASLADLMDQGTAMIAAIRAFAELSGNPDSIFETAELDAPKIGAGSPLPPPIPATDLRTNLNNLGQVELAWKGTTANGTYYDIYRELNASGGFSLIGSISAKRFTDATVPAGTMRASYYLVTRRDDLPGAPGEPVTMLFGVDENQQGGGLSLAA